MMNGVISRTMAVIVGAGCRPLLGSPARAAAAFAVNGKRWRSLVVLGVGLTLTLVACKEEKLPEHLRQQQAQAERRAKKEQQRQQQLKEAPKPEEETWPSQVQEAYYVLSLAGNHDLPLASRRLALLGLEAAPALRKIAATPRHSSAKRAAASLLLVELQMFRPEALAQLAQQTELPIVQRAAIEALARIGNEQSLQALAQLRQKLSPSREKTVALSPEVKLQLMQQQELVSFIDQAQQKPSWGYGAEQLQVLDRLLQARTPAEIEAALSWVKSLTLEPGLLQLLGSSVARPLVQEAAARQLIRLTPAKQLTRLLQPRMPPALRMAAAQLLLKEGTAAQRAQLVRLSKSKQDPFAPLLQQLLSREAMN